MVLVPTSAQPSAQACSRYRARARGRAVGRYPAAARALQFRGDQHLPPGNRQLGNHRHRPFPDPRRSSQPAPASGRRRRREALIFGELLAPTNSRQPSVHLRAVRTPDQGLPRRWRTRGASARGLTRPASVFAQVSEPVEVAWLTLSGRGCAIAGGGAAALGLAGPRLLASTGYLKVRPCAFGRRRLFRANHVRTPVPW